MQSFKANSGSQIRKAMKDGLTVKIGGVDLIDDFLQRFVGNMRDLGSPVHRNNSFCRFFSTSRKSTTYSSSTGRVCPWPAA
jgi:hypothetical protein